MVGDAPLPRHASSYGRVLVSRQMDASGWVAEGGNNPALLVQVALRASVGASIWVVGTLAEDLNMLSAQAVTTATCEIGETETLARQGTLA